MAGLFNQIKKSVDSILPQFFEDENLITQIVWKRFDQSVFSETDGYSKDEYTEFEIGAIRVEESANYKGMSQALTAVAVSVGEELFLVRHEELPSGYSSRDIIEVGSDTFNVVKVLPVFGIIAKVLVRRYTP